MSSSITLSRPGSKYVLRDGYNPPAVVPSGPIVVEVNPRLTTAYIGLGEALDINVAAAVLGVS